jgi:hypothetical protein
MANPSRSQQTMTDQRLTSFGTGDEYELDVELVEIVGNPPNSSGTSVSSAVLVSVNCETPKDLYSLPLGRIDMITSRST